MYNTVKVKLKNGEPQSLYIEVEFVWTDKISAACLLTPDKFISIAHKYLKG